MSEDLPFGEPDPSRLGVLRLLVVALVLGVAVLALVAWAQPVPGGGSGNASLPLLRQVVLAMIVATVPLSLVLRHVMLRQRPDDEQARVERFFVATLASCALLEGVALLADVVYLLGRNPLDLAPAAIAVLVILGGLFPTTGRWRAYDRSGPA